MLKYEDLAKKELVYTWQNPDTGRTRMWSVERLCAWLPMSGHKLCKAILDQEQARYFVENRGIEKHRLAFLAQNRECLREPLIMLRLPGSESSNGELSDLMIDGHHRYVTLALMGYPHFLFYHLTSEEAADFEVGDVPQLDPLEMRILERSPSGIGGNRG